MNQRCYNMERQGLREFCACPAVRRRVRFPLGMAAGHHVSMTWQWYFYGSRLQSEGPLFTVRCQLLGIPEPVGIFTVKQ